VRHRPLVAVLYHLPLLVEALRHALSGVADLRAFESPHGDPSALLTALAADAVIVDSARDAEAALAFHRETRRAAFYIPFPELALHTATAAGWERVPGELSPELVATFISDAVAEYAL
jgi:hypothetical protein